MKRNHVVHIVLCLMLCGGHEFGRVQEVLDNLSGRGVCSEVFG